MSALETFDGLCGIISYRSTFEQQVRCKYEFGHAGPHSYRATQTTGWEQLLGRFCHPVEEYTQNKK